MTDKICSNLYKKYKKEIEHKLWQLLEVVTSISEKSYVTDFKLITFEAKPDLKLIIKSVLEYFTYLIILGRLIIIICIYSAIGLINIKIMDYIVNGIKIE